ncbi:MAG: hypothetical protein ACR2NW_03965 [Thermodesulfobacteriota bacterium]
MENKTSTKNKITTILIIFVVIFVFIFVIHNCWKIHQEDIKINRNLIDIDRLIEDNDKN